MSNCLGVDLSSLLCSSRALNYTPNARRITKGILQRDDVSKIMSTLRFFSCAPLRWPGFYYRLPLIRLGVCERDTDDDALNAPWLNDARVYDANVFMREFETRNAGFNEELAHERLQVLIEIMRSRDSHLRAHYYNMWLRQEVVAYKYAACMHVMIRRPLWSVRFCVEEAREQSDAGA